VFPAVLIETILTITGGFLFGLVPGTIYTMIGATTGVTILFIVAKPEHLADQALAAARTQPSPACRRCLEHWLVGCIDLYQCHLSPKVGQYLNWSKPVRL
jgi:hypothetical protein